jgi:acyl-CoA thioester hydrolase
MRASHVDYLAPARLDDLIEAFVRISRIGTTSVVYECAAYRLPEETLMVTPTRTLVLVDHETRRPTPIPEKLRAAVREFEGIDLVE